MHDIALWGKPERVRRTWSEQLHAYDCYWSVTERSITSGHRILHKMYIQIHSIGTVGLASWSSPRGMTQITGIAHHVLCRTCTLKWCGQMKHSCCLTCAGSHCCM